MTRNEAKSEGFTELFGPCNTFEEFMSKRVVADAEACGRAVSVVREGSLAWVYRPGCATAKDRELAANGKQKGGE